VVETELTRFQTSLLRWKEEPVGGVCHSWPRCRSMRRDHCFFSRAPASPTRTAPPTASSRALACSHLLCSPGYTHATSHEKHGKEEVTNEQLERWRRRRRGRRSCSRTPSRTSYRRSRTAPPAHRHGVRLPPPVGSALGRWLDLSPELTPAAR
jgi:hypothetical protein